MSSNVEFGRENGATGLGLCMQELAMDCAIMTPCGVTGLVNGAGDIVLAGLDM